MLAKRTFGFWNWVCDAEVKSERRVPTAMTTSASCASRFAASPPFEPIGPAFQA